MSGENPNDVLLGKTCIAKLDQQSMSGFQEGEPRAEGLGKRSVVKLKFFRERGELETRHKVLTKTLVSQDEKCR